MSGELTDLQRRFLANAKITPQRVISAQGRAAVADLVSRNLGYTTRCRCHCPCAICSSGQRTDDHGAPHDGDDVRMFFHVRREGPDYPRRDDEDLRESTDAPVFLVQRRRLAVTEPSFVSWNDDSEGLVDSEGIALSDDEIVAHGWGKWEWDTQRAAFTRAEAQAYADGRAHDGPFRVWSVPAMGDLRKLLRAVTDYDRPLLEIAGSFPRAIRYICDLVGGVSPEQVHEDDLQALLTEIHLACMVVDPTLDPDDLRYDRADRPSLLREAADLAAELGSRDDDVGARARAFIERANVILHPRELPEEDPP